MHHGILPSTVSDPAKVSQTTGEWHYYVNGTTGNDANDGLSALTPKQSLTAGFSLIPSIIQHNGCLHVAGANTIVGLTRFERIIEGPVTALIDGGDSVDTIDGDYTATASGVGFITNGVSAWATDAHYNYLIEILETNPPDGAAKGNIRTCWGNDATTLYPTINFNADPGIGATYRIVKQSTTLTGAASSLSIGSISDGLAGGYGLIIQRFFQTGNFKIAGPSAEAYGLACGAISSDSIHTQPYGLDHGQGFFWHFNFDPTTFGVMSTWKAGCGTINANSALHVTDSNFLYVSGCAFKGLSATRSKIYGYGYGTRIIGNSVLYGCASSNASQAFKDSGSAVTKFGGSSGVGLKIEDCPGILINSAINISDNTTHGMEVINSRVKMLAAVTGSGNVGAGCYAHNGSRVNPTSGSPPTLTGAIGDITTDGTTLATTWANVDTVAAYNDLNEQTLIKKV